MCDDTTPSIFLFGGSAKFFPLSLSSFTFEASLPPNMEFTIMDIPDYVSSIAALISFHDITQCVLVNRDWYHQFQRHLWRTVSILDLTNYPPARTLEEGKKFEEYIIRHSDTCEVLPSKSQYIESLTTHSLAALDKLGPAAVNLRYFRCVYPEHTLPAAVNSKTRALLQGDGIDSWEWEGTVAGIIRRNA